MSAANRTFRRPPDFLARRHLRSRAERVEANAAMREARHLAGEAMADGQDIVVPPAPGEPFARCSGDPVAGAVRVIVEAAQEAALMPGPSRRGRPVDYRGLAALLDFVEAGTWTIGVAARPDGPDRRIGTAEKGALVQVAALALNLSPGRVADLARQLADVAGTVRPERKIGGQN